jgi:ribosome-associated protein
LKAYIPISPHILLDPDDIREEFIQSDGPGGQNVNKVASAVRLRLTLSALPMLPEDARQRLARLAGKRLTSQGELVIEARQYRTQEQNRRAALNRLIHLIQAALEKPKPRHKTRPTLASQQRRLAEKKRHGETKRLRKYKSED